MQQQLYNAYILAGGKSSRMGTDKGLLPLQGKPMVQHVIENLAPIFDTPTIVSANEAYSAFGCDRIADIMPGLGPAGGIYTALAHSNRDYNFITSCDMPFVSTAAVEYMISKAVGAQIILPAHDGQIEPLFGIYSKTCLPEWLALIQRGFLKLQEMIACFDLLIVDISGNPLFTDPVFQNINTPDDLNKASINTNL